MFSSSSDAHSPGATNGWVQDGHAADPHPALHAKATLQAAFTKDQQPYRQPSQPLHQVDFVIHTAPNDIYNSGPNVFHSETKRDGAMFAAAVTHVQRDLAENKRGLNLKDCIDDVYEYHGVTHLGFFFIFFLTANLVLFMHWDSKSPLLKSNIQESFKGFGGTSDVGTLLQQVDNMADAATFMGGYLQFMIQNSAIRQLPGEQVFVNEYARILYARITINLQRNCEYEQLLCYKDDGGRNLSASIWKEQYSVPGVAARNFQIAPIINDVTADRASSLAAIAAINDDLLLMAKYTFQVTMDMLVCNQLAPDDRSWLSLRAQRGPYLAAKPGEKVVLNSVTIGLRDKMYLSTQDRARFGFEILYVVFTLYYLAEKVNQAFTSCAQHGWRKGLGRYAKSGWNRTDLVSIFFSLGWMAWYVPLVFEHKEPWPQGSTTLYADTAADQTLDFGVSYLSWLYAGIICNLLIGVRVLKYMRLHGSLRIYSGLLGNAWRRIKDFLWFFMYIMLLLGSCVLAYFQLSGGNALFTTVQDSLLSMALLTFSFLDYPSFENRGLGLGSWSPTIILVFWCSVMLLIVISQNIVLAIVVEAYEEAKEAEGEVEASMLHLMMLRARFSLSLNLNKLRFHNTERFVEDSVSAFESRLAKEGEEERTGRCFNSYVRARWAVALLPESRAMRNYFEDAAAQKIRRLAPWASEREETPSATPNLHSKSTFHRGGTPVDDFEGVLTSQDALRAAAEMLTPGDTTDDYKTQFLVVDLARLWSRADLQALMVTTIPGNKKFVGARHAIWLTRISTCDPDRMAKVADLIWRVYNKPKRDRAAEKSARTKRVVSSWMGRIRHRVMNLVSDVSCQLDDLHEVQEASLQMKFDRVARKMEALQMQNDELKRMLITAFPQLQQQFQPLPQSYVPGVVGNFVPMMGGGQNGALRAPATIRAVRESAQPSPVPHPPIARGQTQDLNRHLTAGPSELGANMPLGASAEYAGLASLDGPDEGERSHAVATEAAPAHHHKKLKKKGHKKKSHAGGSQVAPEMLPPGSIPGDEV